LRSTNGYPTTNVFVARRATNGYPTTNVFVARRATNGYPTMNVFVARRATNGYPTMNVFVARRATARVAPPFGVASRYAVAKSEALASQQSGSQAGGTCF
jgi:hypothetical protein